MRFLKRMLYVGLLTILILLSSSRISYAIADERLNRSLHQQGAIHRATALDWGSQSLDALGYSNGLIEIYNVQKGLLRSFQPSSIAVSGIAWRPAPRQFELAASTLGGMIWIINAQTGKIVKEFSSVRGGYAGQLAWNADGSRLALGSQFADAHSGIIEIWDMSTDDWPQVLVAQGEQDRPGMFINMAWHPTDKNIIAMGQTRGWVTVWNITREQPIWTIQRRDLNEAVHLDWHPTNGQLLVATGKEIVLWDVWQNQKLSEFQLESDTRLIRWNPTGNQFIAESYEGYNIYPVNDTSPTMSVRTKGLSIRDITWSPNGEQIAYIGYNNLATAAADQAEVFTIVDVPR